MNKKLMYALMAIVAMTALNSCGDDAFEKAYDEKTSLDSPFLFSEGYQDTIAYAYDLPTPATDWLGMVKDETKVCKLTIPGTHDTMTGMGFYQPGLKFVFNMTAISQVSTLDEQIQSGLRFFDIRPVVSTDTIAKKKILRLTHGISELDIAFEWTIDQLQSYLKAHPTEFFIAKLQFDNGFEDQKDLYPLLSEVLHLSKYQGLFIDNWRPDITVGEMRGKILLLSRYDLRPLNILYDYPIVYCDWPDEDPDVEEDLNPTAQRNCAMYNMNDPSLVAKLYKQDYYKTTTPKRMQNKQKTVIDMMHSAREAAASDENIWVVNHCSAYTEVSPRGYITNASNLHPLVVDDLLKNEGTVGIIPMDMACHDYVHCVINGGTPYTSDYLYGFYPMSLSLTNLLIKSNKSHFK
ncbi:MAG: hypothetical protein J5931_00395 [Prevotella sp.]|nr:hypothetical protein [Prevotella sp.]